MKIIQPEFTPRFFVERDPERIGIDGSPSRIMEIMYRANPADEAREFGHTWTVRGWAPEDEGKWTFNRSTVAIDNDWWIGERYHATLQDLLNHLEATFIEGVPQPPPEHNS